MISNFLLFFAYSAGDTCSLPNASHFLGFPYWYSYLSGVWVLNDPSNPGAGGACNPQLTNLPNVWLIVMAIIEILLRIAAIMAVIFVIYAGISYTTSQGDPEATGRAKGTLVNALLGLAISVMAAAIVAFIAGSFN
jgi:Type IV secretion system pilin